MGSSKQSGAGVHEVGSFKVNTQEIMVSDPCYTVGTWCQGILKPVVKGDYRAFVEVSDEGEWGMRVKRLKIVHEEASPKIECTEHAKFEVGVDGGQAGFWDLIAYRNRNLVPDEFKHGAEGEWWFQMCHDSFFSSEPWENWYVGPFGVHSSSGFGDGGYDCLFARNERGLIVAAEIVFITEEDEEDPDGV